MITSIILGLGVLGLPLAFSRLGWVLGIAVLCLGALGAVYSGLLIGRVVAAATAKAGQRPTTYSGLAGVAYGPRGGVCVKVVQHMFLAGALVAVQLTAAKCLAQVAAFGGVRMCLVSSHAIIAAAMFPVMQIRKLSEATFIAVLGVAVILVALAIYVVELGHQGVDAGARGPLRNATATAGFPAGSDGFKAAQALSTILFAYQGQTIFPEVISEMGRPQDFPKAVCASVAVMTTTYLAVAVAGYHLMGGGSEYLQKWASKHAAHDVRTTVANVMLALHVLTGYAINGNVWNRSMVQSLVPQRRRSSRAAWASVVAATLACSFAAANVVPGLDGLLSLVGSVCGVSLTFLIPATCALSLLDMRPAERYLHCTVCALGFALMAFGTYSALRGLAADFADSPSPFSCGNTSAV